MNIFDDFVSTILGGVEAFPAERIEIGESAELRLFTLLDSESLTTQANSYMHHEEDRRLERVHAIAQTSDTMLAASVKLAEEADVLRGMAEGDQLGGLHADSTESILAKNDTMHAAMTTEAKDEAPEYSDAEQLLARVHAIHDRTESSPATPPSSRYEALASEPKVEGTAQVISLEELNAKKLRLEAARAAEARAREAV